MAEEKPLNQTEQSDVTPPQTLNTEISGILPAEDGSDLMIENLSGADAKEYVVAWMQEEKRLKREVAELDTEIKLWQDRIVLAKSKNANDLVAEAELKVNELVLKKDTLDNELTSLSSKTEILKEKLKNHKEDIRTVDTDWLLMDLEHLLGKTISDITTDTTFDKLDAQRTLEELKEKMKKPDSSN